MKGKHVKTDHRLRKTLAVSSAAVLLPVLGAVTPAYADSGKAGGNGAQAEQAQGQQAKAEPASQQRQAPAAQPKQAAAEQPASKPQPKPQPKPQAKPERDSTDRSGSSDNPDGTFQGKSPSTPDQDGIGADNGIDNNDKTGPGTDGNNGCGNDPDFEDDNNGNCGGLGKGKVKDTDTDTGGGGSGGEDTGVLDGVVSSPVQGDGPAEDAEVLGVVLVRSGLTPAMLPFTTSATTGRPSADSAVLSASAVRGSLTPTTLPFTGAGTELVALVALTSLAIGGGMVVAGRRETA